MVGSKLEDRAFQLLQEIQRSFGADERAMLFCRNRPTCERMVQRLGCSLYHSTLAEKGDSLAAWVAGDRRIIVATGAMGSGVNITCVRIIVHLRWPKSMVNFVQESRRGGQ